MTRTLMAAIGAAWVLTAASQGLAGLILLNDPSRFGSYEYHGVRTGILDSVGNAEDYSLYRIEFVSVTTLDGTDHHTLPAAYAGAGAAVGTTNNSAADAHTVILKKSWEMTREPGGPDTAAHYGNYVHSAARLWFTSLVDLQYELSGFHENSGGSSLFQVWLRDVTDPVSGPWVADTRIQTNGPGRFTTDGLESDGYYRQGTLTGTIVAGRVYEFYHWGATASSASDDAGATAFGEVQLRLTRVNPVPEPASLMLFSLGTVGLAIGSRRKGSRFLTGAASPETRT